MNRQEILVQARAALQYADTVMSALNALTDGALVHDRNLYCGNIEYAVRHLVGDIERYDALDPESAMARGIQDDIIIIQHHLVVFAAADRAVGWMTRVAGGTRIT